jgi:hypothetical protein
MIKEVGQAVFVVKLWKQNPRLVDSTEPLHEDLCPKYATVNELLPPKPAPQRCTFYTHADMDRAVLLDE